MRGVTSLAKPANTVKCMGQKNPKNHHYCWQKPKTKDWIGGGENPPEPHKTLKPKSAKTGKPKQKLAKSVKPKIPTLPPLPAESLADRKRFFLFWTCNELKLPLVFFHYNLDQNLLKKEVSRNEESELAITKMFTSRHRNIQLWRPLIYTLSFVSKSKTS